MPGAPLRPMLATNGALPAGAGWAYEFKWDGIRAVAALGSGPPRYYARSGAEITAAYPELAGLGAGLADTLLDGEVVVLGETGQPSFTALAERMHVRDPSRAARLAATVPVTYLIFDVPRLRGADLTALPYAARRAALESLPLAGSNWTVPPWFSDGDATRTAAEELGLEGVVAKRLDSVYRPGLRSPDWIKVKLELTAEFVVGGWRPGARALGGLLVGVPGGGGALRFAGRVGGGISAAAQRDLLAALEPLRVPASPFTDVPREDARGAIWTRPVVVIEVRYGQQTPDGRLRFPRFLRRRPDMTPDDVVEGDDRAG